VVATNEVGDSIYSPAVSIKAAKQPDAPN